MSGVGSGQGEAVILHVEATLSIDALILLACLDCNNGAAGVKNQYSAESSDDMATMWQEKS
eukprot:8809635-Ditylum_brightwellii.AAC.1